MPNDLNVIITRKTIDYVNKIDNIGPRFISFFNSELTESWKASSISLLKGLNMSEKDFNDSTGEYSKVTETEDKALQTKLKTEVDGLVGEIERDYKKYILDLKSFEYLKRKGLEGNFKVSPLSLLRNHANFISSKCDLKISKFKRKDTSGGDINFIYAHNIILILRKFTYYMKNMLERINLGSSSGRSKRISSSASIFKEDMITKVICGEYKKGEDSKLKIVFTNKSSDKVDKYLAANSITASESNSVSQTVKKDFIDFVKRTNSADKSSDFNTHLESIPYNSYNVKYENSTPAKVIFEFKAPTSDPGVYYNAVGPITGASYEVKAQSPANDFIFSKKNIVNTIIKNAVGEAPLYRCKHKGKWYYYTPTQLVLNGGKLVDSSGNKFRPKNGRPASLYGMKK